MLKLLDEYKHVKDTYWFHLVSVHTSKVHREICTYPHFNLIAHMHTSLLKDFPLGVIRLTLFHKLTCDLQGGKKTT